MPNDVITGGDVTPSADRNARPSVEATSSPGEGPRLVYVPCTAPGPDETEVQLALKPLEDGRLAMLVFTSLDSLVAGCGEEQPWVALSETQLEDMFQDSGAEVVAVDAELTPGQRWGVENVPVNVADYRSGQISANEGDR